MSVLEAKIHLSALIREIAQGDTIVIASHGRPVAKLAPVVAPVRRRVYGALRTIPGRPEPDRARIAAALAPMTDTELEAEGWA